MNFLTSFRKILPNDYLVLLQYYFKCTSIRNTTFNCCTKYLYFFAKKIERLSPTVSCLVACEASYDDDVL